jgi:ribosomal-protein-alanine N-acetyltransferase
MLNVEIVPFAKEHVDTVQRISTLSFLTPWTKESIEKELDNEMARYVVAVQNGAVIGYGGVWLILGEGHITNIAVHPEYRGIGIGDIILEALISLCIMERVNSMTLEVRVSNSAAQGLYKKHGFKEAGIRKNYYSDTKEDGIIMWKYDI